jgi:hypothetical protein
VREVRTAEWYEKVIAERDPFAVVFANNPLVRRTLARSAHWPKLAGLMKLPESSVAR